MHESHDKAFLTRCARRAAAPQCDFKPAEIARLYRLIGPEWEDTAQAWDEAADRTIACSGSMIRELVELTYDRMAA